MARGGWRPRRSLVFCSWAAEEYGLIGSNEWVQEFAKTLGERAVAYLNVDTAVSGNNSIQVGSTPLMYRAVYEATKNTKDPRAGMTIFDRWLEAWPWTSGGLAENVPTINPPGSGSDHAPFLQIAGVPVVDMSYKDRDQSYPLYHSVYETFYAMENFFDPDFTIHASVTSLWVELARHLADSLILPYNVSDYGVMLEQSFRELENNPYWNPLKSRIQNYTALESSIKTFQDEASRFMKRSLEVNKMDPFALRQMNDQLMQVERAFIDPNGLPGRSFFKHVFLAPSKLNIYEGSSFPGLADLLFEMQSAADTTAQWERVKHHFSVLVFVIQSSASTLRDVAEFSRA